MDILIKNMEMPKSCLGELNGKNDCPIVGICGIFKATPFKEKENIVWEQRLKDCPLVELPDNHGRIVDLDRVLDWLANDKRCFSMAMTSKIEKALSDAPVILEASK